VVIVDPAGQVAMSKFAIWGGGYGDVELRDNIPLSGSFEKLKSTQVTLGLIAGTDWAMPKSADALGNFRLGLFAGLNQTNVKYTDGTYNAAAINGQPIGNCDNSNDEDIHCFHRYDARSKAGGGSVGAYGIYTAGRWSFDLVGKLDINKTRATDKNLECAPDDHGPILRASDQTTSTMTLAGNGSYRIPVSDSIWFEPALGFRYLHLSAGAVTSPFPSGQELIGLLPSGISDGDAFRLQGGLRFGVTARTAMGQWTGVLGGFIYSDVMVTGFSNSAHPSVLKLDEGKLRGLGQMTSTLTADNGVSYQLQGEIRGGEHLLGYGAKFIVRKDW
jgi:hypothetical protein